MQKKNLVILGAGFGGMYTYKSLSKQVHNEYNITIIDKKNHFLFTPLLHEVATGSLATFHVVEPVRSLIRKGTHFIQSSVQSLGNVKKIVHTQAGPVPYDILVFSLGAQTCHFDIPGAAEYTYGLKTLQDAVSLKNHFIKKFEQASYEKDLEERKKILSFTVVGSGPTGVELVGETAELFFGTFEKYYQDMYCCDEVSLTLISSHDSVLRIFNKKLQNYALKHLLKNNITIQKNVRVVEVTPDCVVLNNGSKIPTKTVIWTAGVTPTKIPIENDIFETDKNHILVDEYMCAKNTDNIYVIGDMSRVETLDGKGYPMMAQVAKQQGICVGKNISRVLKNKQVKKFKYTERGMLASLGKYSAVADIFGISFRGRIAWFMWRSIYLINFISWRKRFRIMFDWTVNLFTERDITQL